MKIDLLRANWYAERYMSVLIADGEECNFRAVKCVMKLYFSDLADGIFSITFDLEKKNLQMTIWFIY